MNRAYTAGQHVILNKPKTRKKKNPKNAFSFYLDYALKELRENGQRVANKSEAMPYACEQWKEMTPEEKAPFEQKAKEWKQQKKSQPRSGRLDCTGQLIDNRVIMEDFTETQRKQARKRIRSEWPIGKDEEGYQPCEVACIDYTLNQGVVRVWHQFIDPGPIKLGMRAEIREFAEKTHQIPEEGFQLASSLYHIIWDELLHFVKPDRSSQQFPPIYCKISEMRKTLFCLDWLSANAGVSNKLCNIFEFEDMAAELYSHAGMIRPSLSIIEEGCNSHMYDYEANTTCDYHNELECVHCAILTLKKCCFWMSDSLTKVYGFEITDQHLPVRKPPSFVITRPENVVVDERPRSRRNRSPRTPNGRRNEDMYGARDIRYRGNYDIVPSRLDCTDLSPSTSALGSNLCTDATTLGQGDSGQPSQRHQLSGNTPSLGTSSRRPTTGPDYLRHQQQQNRSRLAANFKVPPRLLDQQSTSSVDLPSRDHIDSLSQDFDAASISSAGTSEFETVTRKKAARNMLGRGRGRGRFN